MRVPSGATGVVDVNIILAGQLPRGGYSTGPTTAVDPVAVKAVKGLNQRKRDETL